MQALSEVDSRCLRRPEVNVVVGENGAGKSTLMNILSGVYVARTTGRSAVQGEEVIFTRYACRTSSTASRSSTRN